MKANKYYVVWKGFAPGVYDSWEEAEIQVSGYPEAQYRAYKTQEAAIEAFREGFDREGLIQDVKRQVKQMQEEGVRPTLTTPGPSLTLPHPLYPPNSGGRNPHREGTELSQPPTTNSSPHAPISARRLTPIGVRDVKVTQDSSISSPPYSTGGGQGVGPGGLGWVLDSLAVDAACSGNPGPMEYRGVFVRTGQQIFKVGPLEGGTNNIGEFLAIVHGLALQEQQGTRFPLYSDSVNAQLWVRQGKCKTKLEPNEVNAPIFEMIARAEHWLATHAFRLPIYKWETKQWGEIPADFGRK